uniref:HSP20-like chaperones superfamily protein n=1 Tax=Kalanchoe fedtschenkoi TaxID=63787 RepID=A0A7N0V6N2_KALFE
MGDAILTTLSMEGHHHPSTLLSMDSSLSSHYEFEREMNRSITLCRPPDINLEPSPPPPSWNDQCDILDVGLATQVCESDTGTVVPKRKCAKRPDSVWGAWLFFSFYFKPVLNEKSKCKVVQDSNGLSGFEKSDLQLDSFLVQHDMENMYMWVFKERPENALGKMQLRSYMNGHSRAGERAFPFSLEKGFVRSHRMQRKHYRGLSNPQCVHGIEVVPSPNLMVLDEEERKRWAELTGRDINFSIPLEASDFSSWRTLPNTDFELERTPVMKSNGNSQPKRLFNSSCLNLTTQSSNHSNGDKMDLSPPDKRRKDFFPQGGDNDCYIPINPHSEKSLDMELHPSGTELAWVNDFCGVMKNVYGPVTGAKTIYEDEIGYLIVVSLPFADPQSVKVTWRNEQSHGIIKIACVSNACMPSIKRQNRTFKLTDPSPEHCPPGELIREISLQTRIPDDATLEAYYDHKGTMLEIMVPKHRVGPEEHEVRVCLRPSPWSQDLIGNH